MLKLGSAGTATATGWGNAPTIGAATVGIDTAPFYGWGRAEEIVGRAIHGRDDVLVFTKCGTMQRANGDDYMDLRPEAIRADVEGSLRRLGVERLDLLQIHDRDPAVPIEETWGAVLELVAEGTVRHGGISNHHPRRSSERSQSGRSPRCNTSTACSRAASRRRSSRSRLRGDSA